MGAGRFLKALAWCAGLALWCSADPALANGRFPRAQRLLEDPADPAHLILGATYGLLITRDAGASWRYVCEAAYGEADLPVDALTALTPEGALLAGLYSGISRAATSACDFRKTLGQGRAEAVPDFTLSASVPGRALAVLVSLKADGSVESQLQRSDDDGLTWSPLGAPLPELLRTVLTVDVAPSDDRRVYLSGLSPDAEGVLLRSDDGGESFRSFTLPIDAASNELPFIAAVDPDDADRLYVRTDLWAYDPARGAADANDGLLYSSDGGESFVELMRAGGKLFGFTFSPDGRELLLGYGDPVEIADSRRTDPSALGIYRAAKGSADFRRIFSGSVGCLTWTERGLYVCAHESEAGFSLGLIDDSDFGLDAPPDIAPLLRLAEVAGPIECGACSAGAVCANYWLPACEGWGRNDCERLDPPQCGGAGAGGEMPPVAGGASSGEGHEQGGRASSTDAPAFEAVAGARGGCACRIGAATGHRAGWLTLALLGALALLRARPRRRLSRTPRCAAAGRRLAPARSTCRKRRTAPLRGWATR